MFSASINFKELLIQGQRTKVLPSVGFAKHGPAVPTQCAPALQERHKYQNKVKCHPPETKEVDVGPRTNWSGILAFCVRGHGIADMSEEEGATPEDVAALFEKHLQSTGCSCWSRSEAQQANMYGLQLIVTVFFGKDDGGDENRYRFDAPSGSADDTGLFFL